tara:strand:- start:330 stop:452 length:123 start_codon:yes stop_codon:yes gene_type:complete
MVPALKNIKFPRVKIIDKPNHSLGAREIPKGWKRYLNFKP